MVMDVVLPAGVQLGKRAELDLLTVETDSCTAELVLHGAIVTRWQPVGQKPVLFAGDGLDYRPGVSMHAGIPLCGPWFGPGRSGDRKPAHGFYRSSLWRLAGAEQTGIGTDVVTELRLELTAEDLVDVPAAAGWPRDARLSLRVRLGTTLQVTLTTQTGIDGADLEEALHTYLHVGDVRQVRLFGLDSAEYIDKVAGGEVRVQHGDVTFSGETDRVYSSGSDVVVYDPVLGRRLTVAKEHSSSTVIWNPGQSKGAALADVGGQWPEFVCVEAANALDGAVVIPPDSEHSITTTISVTRA